MIAQLGRAFASTPLKTLILRGNALGRDGFRFVARSVKANKHMRTFILRQNPLEYKADAVVLAGALRDHPTVKALHVVECTVGRKVCVLSEIVSLFSCLTIVDLSGNQIDTKSVEIM